MNQKYIDFEAVKASTKIADVADALGFDLKEKNNQLRGVCIVCEKGGPRAFCITPEKERYYCFGCQTGGDCIALAAHVKGVHPKEAAFWIAEHFGIQSEEKNTNQGPKRSSEEGFQPLDYIQPDHEAVEALGLAPEDAERIGAGYAPRGVMRGQVAIPIRLEDGKLVGYLGISEAILPKSWKW